MMRLNHHLIHQVQAAKAKLLVVTKYWNKVETEQITTQIKNQACIFGWGENRVQSLVEKGLPREQTHFIGRLQSRQFEEIITHCSTLHSLATLSHAEKLNKKIEQNKRPPLKIFVQVNVAQDPAKEGIKPLDLKIFLTKISGFKYLEVIGLSSMGWAKVETKEERKKKRAEFKDLIKLRDKYLPEGITSAGTSRDYVLALEAGIDVVRVGQGIVL